MASYNERPMKNTADFRLFPFYSRPAALPLPGLNAREKQKLFFSDFHLQQNDNPGAPQTVLV